MVNLTQKSAKIKEFRWRYSWILMTPTSVRSLARILNPYSNLLLPSFTPSRFHPIRPSTPPSIATDSRFSTYRISAGEDQQMENMRKQAASLSPAKRFWNNSTRDAAFSLYSPFVVCLASGTLDVDVFRQYIVQDKKFLQAFAHAWGLGVFSWLLFPYVVFCCKFFFIFGIFRYEMVEEGLDCVDDDARDTVAELRFAILEELKLHNSVCKVSVNLKDTFSFFIIYSIQ